MAKRAVLSKRLGNKSEDPALAKARRLLKRIPLVDGHNDLPWVIYADAEARGDVQAYDLNRVHQDGDTDIPSMKMVRQKGGQAVAVFDPELFEQRPEPTLRSRPRGWSSRTDSFVSGAFGFGPNLD